MQVIGMQATQGNYLFDGIFFDPSASKINANSSETESTMNIEYPRLKSQPLGGDEYHYYEFNSNGTAKVDFQNAWLVSDGVGVLFAIF